MKNQLKSSAKSLETVNITNYQQIADIEIIASQMMRSRKIINILYRIDYCPQSGKEWRDVTKMSQKPVSNNTFAFNNGDFVVLKYDENDTSLKIEAHYNGDKVKQKNDNDNINPIVVTSTDNSCLPRNAPITAKNDKIFLKNGYDYVLACCLHGCDKRAPGMNNVYVFSGN